MGLAEDVEDRLDAGAWDAPQVVEQGELLGGRAELLQVLDQRRGAVGLQERGQGLFQMWGSSREMLWLWGGEPHHPSHERR